MPREQVFEGVWQFLFVCEIVKWSVKQQSQSASVSSEEEGLCDSVSCYTFIAPSTVKIKLIWHSHNFTFLCNNLVTSDGSSLSLDLLTDS